LPMFQFLGWDIHNINADEVTPEERISKGRVDWAFRIDGIPKFFLEAKAMKVDLDVAKWAEQAINYAWNKGCTWAVLTDFEGIKIFNADVSTKNLKESLFFEIPVSEYLTRFDQLWLLSKEAFKEGLLDKEAEKWGKKIKRTPVGERLFQDMMGWRMLLTKGFHKANTLTPDELDEGIQRVLDRLVFIRVTEDRGIEPNILLSTLRTRSENKSLVKILTKIFRDFDEGYNSKLFTHHSSENWQIDNETLERVINGLYETGDGYRYDFSAISADVLGGIYEQYLGHILKQATKRASVKKEHKKRKEQGIYYTPQFVVDYIVKNTIGKILKENSYREMMDLKVLDPACGSGSFLIRAYDELVNYFEKKDKQANLFTRFRILTANIYGVDLDAQAVEIAQLNLLLKTLSTKARLPNLAGKIRIGNSLISDNSPHPPSPQPSPKGGGGEGQGEREQPVAAGFSLREYFGDNFHEKKPFTYEKEFPEVFNRKNPGFDVIIGNPPYVRIQTLPKDEVRYYSDNFVSARGSYDIYLLFIERALSLLRKGGVAGFILPNKFMVSDYGEGLRKLLSSEQAVWKIVDFGDAQVFEGATTYTMLLFLQKTQNRDALYISASDYLKQNRNPNLDVLENKFVKVSHDKFTAKPWSLATSRHSGLIERIEKGCVRVGDIAEKMFQGLVTSADKVYLLQKTDEQCNDKKLLVLYSLSLEKKVYLEKEIVHLLLKGSLDVRRFYIEKVTRFVLFPYKDGKLITQNVFENQYPQCWQYLLENKKVLMEREKGKMKHSGWYGYVYPKNLTLFETHKLLTPSIAKQASFAYDEKGEYYFVGSGGGGGGGYGIIFKEDLKLSPLYILALLNSRLLDFYLQNISSPFRHGYFAYNKQYVEQIPIKLLDLSNPAEKAKHDELVSLAEKMLRLNRELQKVSENTDRWYSLKSEIAHIDKEIDERVYELYRVTEEEREIIERGK
ncbi:MAG: N-6 DNA methylase, partial [Deltaproteobacteria bacterium]|nr:N-6 DNA methylase [Deltaproteobacteria bacterium]